MTIRDMLSAGIEIEGIIRVACWQNDECEVCFEDQADRIGDQEFLDREITFMFANDGKLVFDVLPAQENAHSDICELTRSEAWGDVMNYLRKQDDDWYEERDRIKEEVLNSAELIDDLVEEHLRCVNRYGLDREWSVEDACENEPGIWR